MINKKITVRGKTYDLDDLAEAKAIQSVLVPENWPTTKAECVRLFLSTRNMIALELGRHLAANWKQICKTAQEEAAEDNAARVSLSFAFQVDQTAPSVVALTKLGLSFNVKHGTKGKPRTHDLNQGDFLDDDLGVILDVRSVARESSEQAKAEAEEGKTEETPAAPGTTVGGDVTPENTPGDAPPKRSHKKKS